MSRIGKNPVQITDGVTAELKDGNTIFIKGPKGELSTKIHPKIKVEIKDGQIICTRSSDEKFERSLHGLSRSLIANMITGVTEGFEKQLEIHGVGYRFAIQGSKAVLSLGYSHPIEYEPPEGIQFELDKEKKNILTIKGIDKQVVGEVAAKIRSYRKPEPYKGKGIRYVGETVTRKAGKAAASKEG